MLAAATAGAQPEDRWATLRPLLGAWEGTSSGQPGLGTVRREYRLVLGDRYVEVRNTSTYPPQEKNPKGEVHEDRGYISYDSARKQFVFRQFHVEGFVSTYVASPADRPIVFNSEAIENIPAGWKARETYRLEATGELVEVFELAEPGQEFTVYSETRLRRVSP
jgi:THAP4-like, heme-binding beta-barrel domain